MSTKKDNLSFEEAVEQLEEIIGKLEEGNLCLDESLSEFQKGINLYKYCNNILNKVDGDIKLILEEDDTIKEINFEDNL